AGYDIWLFILLSAITRGERFFIAAVLLNRYGETIRHHIEKRLGLWVAIGAAVLVGGFLAAFRLF
ncbi:MAG: DedA family protein, partial [Afipia sp.]|nr:DedA family protein [Afipia sp.]